MGVGGLRSHVWRMEWGGSQESCLEDGVGGLRSHMDSRVGVSRVMSEGWVDGLKSHVWKMY